MVTYQQAYEIERNLKRNIDACDEYSDAYAFKCRAAGWGIGGDGACIVLKENGRAINQLEYFDNYEADHIREFDV